MAGKQAVSRVTLSDGSEFEVTHAPDATPEEIMGALNAQMGVGSPQLAEADARGYRMQTPEEVPAWQRAMQSGVPGVATAVGALRGVKDVIDTGAEAASWIGDKLGADGAYDAVRAANQQAQADYNFARSGEDGFDWGRLAGQVAGSYPLAAGAVGMASRAPLLGPALTATKPAAAIADEALAVAPKLTMGARMGQGAIEGATGAMAVSSTNDEPWWRQAATGGAFGAAAAPVAAALGVGGGAVLDKGKQLWRGMTQAGGQITEDVGAIRRALEALGQANVRPSDITVRVEGLDGPGLALDFSRLSPDVRRTLDTAAFRDLTPQQLQRVADFEALNVPYSVGDATRRFGDQQFEREIAKNAEAGQPIRDLRNTQNARLTEVGQQFQSGLGGQTSNAFDTGKSVTGALKARQQEVQQVIDAAYQAAREAAQGAPSITLAPLQKTLTKDRGTLLSSQEGTALLRGFNTQLKAFGAVDAKGNWQQIGVDTAEEVRKWLNSVRTPQNARQVEMLKDAVDESVLTAGEGDIFNAARFAHSVKKAQFSDPKLTDSLLKMASLTDRAVDYEDVTRTILRGGINDLKNIRNTLLTPALGDGLQRGGVKAGREAVDAGALGPQAWNDLRAHVFADALEKAFPQVAPNELNARIFSGPAFKKALDKIGNDKLKILFTPDELAQLGALTRASIDLTTAVPGAVNNSNTSSALFNMVERIYGVAPKPKQAGAVSTIVREAAGATPGLGMATRVGEGLSATGRNAKTEALQATQAAGAANPAQALADLAAKTRSTASQQAMERIMRTLFAGPGGPSRAAGIAVQPNDAGMRQPY